MTLAALDALGRRSRHRAAGGGGKAARPPRCARASRRGSGAWRKPAVVAMLGREVGRPAPGERSTVTTLEDAAAAALAALVRDASTEPGAFAIPTTPAARLARAERRWPRAGRRARALRGRHPRLRGASHPRAPAGRGGRQPERRRAEPASHRGSRRRTSSPGDARIRCWTPRPPRRGDRARRRRSRHRRAAGRRGAGPRRRADPAGDIAPALEAARAHAQGEWPRPRRGGERGRHIRGSAGARRQVARLESAGAWVLPSNAQAARAAAAIAGGAHVTAEARCAAERAVVAEHPRDLFGRELRVVNVGLEGFADDAGRPAACPCSHVEWMPPAGGDPARGAAPRAPGR